MIESFVISQSNLTNNFKSLSVHNPLVFIVDAIYNGVTPSFIYCEIKVDTISIGQFRCVPYADISLTRRAFMFRAETVIKAYMEKFDQTASSVGVLEPVPELTKSIELIFSDPNNEGATTENIEFIAVHSARSFGENPCLENIESNQTKTYYAFGDYPVSVYFFNNDINNILSLIAIEDESCLDYDDDEFTDFDDDIFTSIF